MASSVPVRGVKRYVSKGKWFCYHRKSGRRIEAPFGSAAFFLEVEAIERSLTSKAKPIVGTLSALFESYRRSLGYTDLADKTRKSYASMMDILAPIGARPVVDITPAFIANLRDELAISRGRRTANYVLAVLSVAAKHGIERGLISANPASNVKRVRVDRKKAKANRPWTADERQAAMMGLPPHIALVVGLAMFTGLRKGDVLRLGREALQDGRLRRQTGKTGQVVAIPVHDDLRALLEARTQNVTAAELCLNLKGKAWTESGFDSSFGKAMDKLATQGLVGDDLTFHGLRHTVGTLLRGATDDLDLIRRWLGQKTLSMAIHYSETADTSDQMDDVMTRFDPLRTSKGCLTGSENLSNRSTLEG